MANVYISAHNPGLANQLASALAEAGHNVVSQWHHETDTPPRTDAVAWGEKASRNLHVIDTRTDTLALIAGSDRYPGGKFIEAGYALSIGVAVYTVGGIENGMLQHPDVRHVADAKELLDALAG